MSVDSTKFLVTLSEMLDYLKLENATTTQQDQLGFFINMVSEFADTYTNRNLLAADYTERYDGNGTQELRLRQYPINSTSATISAYIDADWGFNSDDKVDAEDLFIDSGNGIIVYKDGVWRRGKRNIQVAYNAGFETVPYDLELSVQEAVAFFWELAQQKMWAKQSLTKGETSVTRIQNALPESVTAIWDRYRKIR